MILSVSRRTDIPNYYSDWFYNRIKEGFLYVRNPMNTHQVSKIILSPDVVDCIVFWTKNPENMIERLDELKEYPYYFQFTLTGYGKEIEPNLPPKRPHLISTFKRLSDRIGSDRIIWRYDPVLLNSSYTMEYHRKAFAETAKSLSGYTNKVIISFVDLYAKIKHNMERLGIRQLSETEMIELGKVMAEIASKNEMQILSCAEKIDLSNIGIANSSCIDRHLIEKIIACKLHGQKDKNQRAECACFESIEVGAYNTCRNGCRYCYANHSDRYIKDNVERYQASAPLLCSELRAGDIVTERSVKSLKQ